MRNGFIAKLCALVCAIVLSGSVLAGCAGGANNALSEEQKANRSYMSQVNQVMTELDEQLEGFVDAVSRGDVVNMRSQADNAYRSLDKLAELEAPEELKDIKEGYVSGTTDLRKALDEYIALYTEASGSSFDWSTYDKRIAAVQELYDKGVGELESADKAAADKS